MVKISVIIPIYNAESFLNECLVSIQNQTFTDYEVWLIDDGSTDNSGTICDKFATQNKQFHVIHKKNGGVSSARNTGLEKAKGEWICFMDADDTVENEYLSTLYQVVNNQKDLLIIQGFKTFLPDNTYIDKCFTDQLYNAAQILDIDLIDHIIVAKREYTSVYTYMQEKLKKLKNRKKPDGFGDKISRAQKGRKKSELELLHLRESNKIIAEKNRGKKRSAETRNKISKSLLGHKGLSGKDNPMYGKSHSKEAREKISKAKKGKYTLGNSPNSKCVICIDTGEMFTSIKEATLKYPKATHISDCCKNIIKSSGKLHWRYKDEN